MVIEVELRTFISQKKYEELLDYFAKEGVVQGVEEQETWYFNAPVDLRIQRSTAHAKVWLKKGKMHAEHREEFEVLCKREDFDTLAKIFFTLGYGIKIKWLRLRKNFLWKGISVSVDHTKGYGFILELEKKCEPSVQEAVLKELKTAIQSLAIVLSSQEDFDQAFSEYSKNWKTLLEEK